MHELKKNWNVFTSKFVGTGPSSYENRLYRAAVSQRLRNIVLEYISISGIIWWPKCSSFENYLNLTVTYWNVLLMKVRLSKGNERPRLERPWPPSLCMFPSLFAKVGLILLRTIGQTNLALNKQNLYTPVTQETSFTTWESSRRSSKS